MKAKIDPTLRSFFILRQRREAEERERGRTMTWSLDDALVKFCSYPGMSPLRGCDGAVTLYSFE